MKLSTIKIISILGIFLLSFLTHYVYELFPNFITSILFPINESVFEHMKLIFITYLIWNIIENILLKKNNHNNNLKPNIIISVFLNIIIFLIMFYPIYLNFKHNLIVTLIIYFISICLTQIVSFYILKSDKKFKLLNDYFYFIITISIIIFAIMTYFPLNNNFFIDYMNKKIGFSNYY